MCDTWALPNDVHMPVFAPGGTCKPSSEPFLSSSELEEVVLEQNWYFLFTVMGMLQLSRYLRDRKQVESESACLVHVHVHKCLNHYHSGIQTHIHTHLPDDTVEAADLLVGADSLVFAGEVLHACCSTVSGLQKGRRVLQAHRWTPLSCCC